MSKCKKCKKSKSIIEVEYYYDTPYRYDGISEYLCDKDLGGCGYREGRWTKKELKIGELEPPYGDESKITNEERHYNI